MMSVNVCGRDWTMICLAMTTALSYSMQELGPSRPSLSESPIGYKRKFQAASDYVLFPQKRTFELSLAAMLSGASLR